MNIPKSFKLMGQTITVEFDESLHHNEDVHGWAKYRQNKIVLQPNTTQSPITSLALEHNFIHELMHFILYMSAEDQYDPPLHQKECLVDRIAGLIHQATITSIGSLNETSSKPKISSNLTEWINKLDKHLTAGYKLSLGNSNDLTHDFTLLRKNPENDKVTGITVGKLEDLFIHPIKDFK